MMEKIIDSTKSGFTLKKMPEYGVSLPKDCEGLVIWVVSNHSNFGAEDDLVEYDVRVHNDIYSSAKPSKRAWEKSREAARYFSDVLNGRSIEFEEVASHGNITLKRALSNGRFVVEQPKKFDDQFFVEVSLDGDRFRFDVLADLPTGAFTPDQFEQYAKYASNLAEAVIKFEETANSTAVSI